MVKLTFFLSDDQFLIARTKLGYISSRMHFFSFEPETTVEGPEFGMGREGMHEWDRARCCAALLFIAVANVAGLEEGRASLVCFINCLVWDLLLMTKKLCSLLLSPCSNNVLVRRVGCTN
jgi:hypothetical protein